MNRAFPVVIALLVAACTGGSVGWGGTYQIIREEPNLIIITYDPMVFNLKRVFEIADRHCWKDRRTPVMVSNTGGGYGAIAVVQFDCVAKTSSQESEPGGT